MGGEFKLYLKRKGLTDRSIDQHCRRLAKILPFDPSSFTLYVSNLSPCNINKYCQTGKHWCDLHKIPYDSELFKVVRERPRTTLTFTEDEIHRFLQIKTPLTVYWYIVAYHGFRQDEVRKLRAVDVDLAARSITLPTSKTGTGRTVKIHSDALEVIKKYMETCGDELFPVCESTTYFDFKLRIKKLGITKGVTPRSFRKSCATRLLNTGVPLFVVQDILGHTDANTTRMYYKGDLSSQDKAYQKDPLKKQTAEDKVKQLEEQILELLQGDARFNQTKIRETLGVLWSSIS